MSRPETVRDLPKSERFAPAITVHSMNLLSLEGDTLRGLAEIVDLLDSSRWLEETDRGSDRVVYMCRRLSSEVRESLVKAQEIWDWRQSLYERAAAGEIQDSWDRVTVDEHAKAEGLDPIDWDALDAHAAAEGLDPIDWDALDAAEAEEGGETA